MLFQNIDLLDERLEVQEDCYVGVKDGLIAYIGKSAPVEDYGETYDGRGKLLMSAFYNAHAHNAMTLLRGYGESLPLHRWLNERIFPFEAQLTPDDVYYGTLLGIAEMVRSGTSPAT